MKKHYYLCFLCFSALSFLAEAQIQIAGPANVCVNSIAEYTAGYLNCGSNYKWSCSGCTFLTPQNGYSSVEVHWTSTGNRSISVNYNGRRCDGKPDNIGGQSLSVTVMGAPSTPTSISGGTCISNASQTLTYSVSPVSGASGYSWTVSGTGWTASSTTGQTISVNAPAGSAGASICVRATATCGNSAYYCINVTRNSLSDILYDHSCQNRLSFFSIPETDETPGATYIWDIPDGNGWSIAAGGADYGQGYPSIRINVGTTAGDVCVTKSVSGCASSTYCETLNPTSCGRLASFDKELNGEDCPDENCAGTTFRTYPNPVKDFLTVEAPSDNQYQLSLYNLNGEEIRKIAMTGKSMKIKTNNLTNGLYILVLKSDRHLYKKSILIKHDTF